ncbi:hypothetical protein RJ639_002043 [Escallonia herrerae]|uniref:CWF19-like protein 2 n=1 Tax=Escallonia herrerae TaxID=1293975 RepID=A0AA88XBT7_9ASTE|nr:hypothetical protein RJ639_002043 [Escallonia herrerae]
MIVRQKKKEEDADSYLAQQIVQNKLYSISGGADDEYDYDGAPRRKIRKKEGSDHKSTQKASFANRILTQQERCQYCFENPKRPRHLIVAIANFTYLMLPQWQPIVPGHCCILPMQHESATRTIDNNVWDELRNFKKCLIMMFAKQEKDAVFLETVMGLAQQRRHCLVECIPLPQDIAKAAPLYFKKAIDEAEDEWSQHNAKKLIDTSEKGLRGSIPKDFPYFHVEFGLKKGFVHVIDDEKTFKSNFGLNVIRGMLRLPIEDMHRRRQNESTETQRQAVANDDIIRRDMGLEWMLRPKDDTERKSVAVSDHEPEEPQAEEVKKVNPRELNPYLKDNGSGYPEDADGTKPNVNHHMSSSAVGDGGASWRLKALKRAKEQAAREGRKLDDVVEERWGSLGQLAVSVASRTAAPSHAHLHATRNRRRELTGEQLASENRSERVTEKDVSVRHADMKVPKLHDSLSWGKRKRQAIYASESDDSGGSYARRDRKVESERVSSAPSTSSESKKSSQDYAAVNTALSANQLAAKVMQLRMKGKHDEAEKLMKEADKMKAKHDSVDETKKSQDDGRSRYVKHDMIVRQKKKEEDADSYLAQQIVQNKLYSISGGADDEYDYDGAPRRKILKKEGNDHKSIQKASFANRILTQQERCQYCFENPKRPRHLIVAIANSTYLMLPLWQPIVPGHCCILPMQHESATRTIDNNVWVELRNFKKCLIMMFAKQEKDVVFLETVMGLAQQRRHCLVECIPLPQDIAKAAPLYFKKAIDEAEDEWSQHNAKKLIDTSEIGLRGSIPKDFPYFHVEFGLKKGFVHVIDDEKTFKSNFGLNVIRGMLCLPVEDMHRRRQNESTETQRQAVASFARDWEPFDWTKQLG